MRRWTPILIPPQHQITNAFLISRKERKEWRGAVDAYNRGTTIKLVKMKKLPKRSKKTSI